MDSLSINGCVKSCDIKNTLSSLSFLNTSISFSLPSSSKTPVISSKKSKLILLPPSFANKLRIARSIDVCILLNSPPDTVSIGVSIPLFTTTIFNFTTCNGGTIIDNKEYLSKVNQALIFNNQLEHQGFTQTDTPIRIVLNIVTSND